MRVAQQTVNRAGEAVVLEAGGRHDPCVLPRAVPMVEAMVCLTLADHWLRQRTVDVLARPGRQLRGTSALAPLAPDAPPRQGSSTNPATAESSAAPMLAAATRRWTPRAA